MSNVRAKSTRASSLVLLAIMFWSDRARPAQAEGVAEWIIDKASFPLVQGTYGVGVQGKALPFSVRPDSIITLQLKVHAGAMVDFWVAPGTPDNYMNAAGNFLYIRNLSGTGVASFRETLKELPPGPYFLFLLPNAETGSFSTVEIRISFLGGNDSESPPHSWGDRGAILATPPRLQMSQSSESEIQLSGLGWNELGETYENGDGVAKNDGKAVECYRHAADQGHAAGQNSLGLMYENGTGVPQDYAEAVKWYRKAADQGFEPALKALAEMGR